MSQHDFDIANQTAPNSRADINLALKALASNSSGSVAPTTTYANMTYYNTSTNILYKRNEADSAWITLGTIDETAGTFTQSGERALATQVQAEAGTDSATLMTPLRTEQHTLSNDLGWGQTWQVMSRAFGTNYTNSTGKPIQVSVYGYAGNTTVDLQLYVGGVMVQRFYGNPDSSDIAFTVSAIVPNGAVYKVTQSGFYTHQWNELR